MKDFVFSFLMIFTTSFAFSTTEAEEEEEEWTNPQTNQDANKTFKTNLQADQQEKEKAIEINSKSNLQDKQKESPEQISQENKEKESLSEKADKKEEDKKPEPSKLLKVGNLAFPVSQQPTPLISFGQNLIAEKQVEVQMIASEIKGKNFYFIEVAPSIVYAFRDDFSIYINVPDAVRFRQDKHHASGLEDVQIQFEYAPYTKEHYTSYDQISVVVNVTLPTGSVKKNPSTGKGSNSFFVGFVYSRMSTDWFYFTSYGGIFNASSHRTQFGNQFLYQYGIGNRLLNTKNWLFDWMIEVNGQYTDRNKIGGHIDPNSGGNIIYITPSLFLSSKESLVMQAGVSFPVLQQVFGHQKKQEYLMQTKISWNF